MLNVTRLTPSAALAFYLSLLCSIVTLPNPCLSRTWCGSSIRVSLCVCVCAHLYVVRAMFSQNNLISQIGPVREEWPQKSVRHLVGTPSRSMPSRCMASGCMLSHCMHLVLCHLVLCHFVLCHFVPCRLFPARRLTQINQGRLSAPNLLTVEHIHFAHPSRRNHRRRPVAGLACFFVSRAARDKIELEREEA